MGPRGPEGPEGITDCVLWFNLPWCTVGVIARIPYSMPKKHKRNLPDPKHPLKQAWHNITTNSPMAVGSRAALRQAKRLLRNAGYEPSIQGAADYALRQAPREFRNNPLLPAAYNAVFQGRMPPPVHRKGNEMIDNVRGVNGSTAAIWEVMINPGNPTLFPRLSVEAKMYDRFRFNSLRISYTPSIGTTATGSVAMAFDTDINDKVPTTLEQIVQNPAHVQGAPYSPWSWDVPVSLGLPTKEYKKIISSFASRPDDSLSSSSDHLPGNAVENPNDLFQGKLYFGAVNNGTTSGLGALKIEYDVTFFEPTYLSSKDKALSAHMSGTCTGGVVTTCFVKGSDAPVGSLSLGIKATNELHLPIRGTYLVILQITGTTLVSASPTTSWSAHPLLSHKINAAATEGTYFYYWHRIQATSSILDLANSTALTMANLAATITVAKLLVVEENTNGHLDTTFSGLS